MRGVLGLDERALCGVASVARPAARIEVLTSVIPSDGIPGIERLDVSWRPGIEAAWSAAGIELTSMCEAAPADISATSSSWARRLGAERAVWRLDGVRSG